VRVEETSSVEVIGAMRCASGQCPALRGVLGRRNFRLDSIAAREHVVTRCGGWITVVHSLMPVRYRFIATSNKFDVSAVAVL
jgi:hypothetical protein